MSNFIRPAWLVPAILLQSACVYRADIQQGNYLDPAAVSQLEVGMTRSQVRYLLGTPQLPDAFDIDRWDYLYRYQKGRKRNTEQRLLTVYFDDDKVARIAKDNVPEPLYTPIEPASATEPANVAAPPPGTG